MREIRTSAKAVVVRDGRLLALRLRDADGVFYILPGGGQEPGESLRDAVRREVAEETGIDVRPGELLFVIEGPKGESFHRIDLVFECEYIGQSRGVEPHADTNQEGVEWLDVASLYSAPLYPSRLRAAITEHCAGRRREVYLGCESEGDPEVRTPLALTPEELESAARYTSVVR